jgi:hypothetical protein
MRGNLLAPIVVAMMLALTAEALESESFRMRSTADLVEICSVSPSDSMYATAIGFCHGYGVGAFHYYQAANAGPRARPFVCLPNPPPSRTEALQMFLAWARENPQHMGESAVESLFRWLESKWPCAK